MSQARTLMMTAFVVGLSGFAFGEAGTITIASPPHGAVVNVGTVDLVGSYEPATEEQRRCRIFIGAAPQPVTCTASAGRWKVAGAYLPKGISPLRVVIDDVGQARFIVTRAELTSSTTTSPQRIGLEWSPGTASMLMDIARRTVSSASRNELAQVAPRVRSRVFALTTTFLNQYNVAVDEGPPLASPYPGQLVTITDEAVDNVYGSTANVDCGNTSREGRSYVYLGTLDAKFMIEGSWAPATMKDSVEQRIEDLSYAVARTAIHEALHGLGLLGCAWMPSDPFDPMPCHSHPNAESDDGTWLFGGGRRLMDSGRFVSAAMRIGEWHTATRGTRAVSPLSPFDRGYLGLVLGGTPVTRWITVWMVLVAGAASALDVDYQMGTLPRLAAASDLVITVAASERVPTSDRDACFRLRREVSLYERAPAGRAPAVVACASRVLLSPEAELAGRVVFLRAPRPREKYDVTVERGVPLYTIVSGRYGTIFVREDGLAAIRAFFEARGSADRLQSWIERYADSSRFLADSSIVVLGDRLATDESVLSQIRAIAVKQPRFTGPLAVAVVAQSASPARHKWLADLADDPQGPMETRLSAVGQLAYDSQGVSYLRQWSQADGPLAAPAHQLLMERIDVLPWPMVLAPGSLQEITPGEWDAVGKRIDRVGAEMSGDTLQETTQVLSATALATRARPEVRRNAAARLAGSAAQPTEALARVESLTTDAAVRSLVQEALKEREEAANATK